MFLSSYVAVSEFANRLRRNTSGVTAIEYGLIAGLIAVVIIVAVTGIGTQLDAKFTAVQNALTPAAPAN
jgi:pilus assembly protein Flp/PilA